MARDRNLPVHAHDNESTLNTSLNQTFGAIVGRRISRRDCMQQGFFAAAFAVLPGVLAGCGDDDMSSLATQPLTPEPTAPPVPRAPPALGFVAVPKGLDDYIRVPDGYTAVVLTAMGDPIDEATPAYANDGTDTTFSRRIGDHGDALIFF